MHPFAQCRGNVDQGIQRKPGDAPAQQVADARLRDGAVAGGLYLRPALALYPCCGNPRFTAKCIAAYVELTGTMDGFCSLSWLRTGPELPLEFDFYRLANGTRAH
jgi:hypothetical protein